MFYAGCQVIADLHDKYGSLFTGNFVLALLGGAVWILILQLLGSNKINIFWKNFFYIIILNRHVFFGFFQRFINLLDDFF